MKKIVGFLMVAMVLNWGVLEGVRVELSEPKDFEILTRYINEILAPVEAFDQGEKLDKEALVREVKDKLLPGTNMPCLFMLATFDVVRVVAGRVALEKIQDAILNDPRFISRPVMQERDAAYVIILIILLAIARIDVTKKALKAPYDFTVWVLENGYKMSNEIYVFLREKLFRKKRRQRYRRRLNVKLGRHAEQTEGI